MINYYESSRNAHEKMCSSEAILKGLSSDGGLYVLRDFDKHTFDIELLPSLSYMEIALSVMSLFFPDFDSQQIEASILEAYSLNFSDPAITPLKKVGNNFVLELFHGPTQAFKDIALSILPSLMNHALEIQQFQKDIMILTATSGDTGKAALEGFKNKERMNIIVFFPNEGVSKVQELQMITQEGKNVHVCAINGNFDDAQSIVKELFLDEDLKTIGDKFSYQLSSANSVNIGRLIPQVIYYFDAYKQLLNTNEITMHEKVNFIVPTGNFGNILAGYIAKKLGLPINKLVSASNANNVLHDFISTGVYDTRRPFIKTSSPSMDILISSNLERLLYYASGQNNNYVKECMDSLKNKQVFQVSEEIHQEIQKDFLSGYALDDEVSDTIATVYKEEKYLLDPHTAVAWKVMSDLKLSDHKNIVIATASPYKFPGTTGKALGIDIQSEDDFVMMDAIHSLTQIPIPEALVELKHKKILHDTKIDTECMKSYVISKVGQGND
ncbi:threonine synthase [Erysipelothrix sp. HDW6A]|uniref:threonine synthase n=1 Tax=Erysipelothrix sp. HDW6A TaxID=2714928 RepID=UPI001408F49A|nr:threonine synthase [Erysipelothrix sp. HDW6A]QIK58074.1 threonine synthase [Erysipelothrix sp. HDW6A]